MATRMSLMAGELDALSASQRKMSSQRALAREDLGVENGT